MPGDGIRIFGSSTLIERNSSLANSAGGISVGRRTGFPPGSLPPNRTTGNPRGMGNQILRNVTGDNGILDLWDSNPGCDDNTWTRNRFETAEPPCTRL